MMIRTYTELSKLHTFEERFKYLRLKGEVGKEIWGFDRYLNQRFYHSKEWRSIRNQVIIRDRGCDLGIEGFEIPKGRALVHHMNPITQEDIENGDFSKLLNPEFLITTTHNTHQAITYGDEHLLITAPTERKPNDTCPWKH